MSLSSGDADDFRGFPAIAAAGDRVHVTWMERSGGLFNVWYRGSIDRGKRWSKPLRLSRPERPTDLLTTEGFKEPGGHYMSLAEDGRGTAHAAWGVGKGTTRVGAYPANKLGLFDMLGNVWQWCADAFPEGSNRVNRGGCLVNYGSGCQAAVRNGDSPSFRTQCIGVRLARIPVR